VEIQYEEEQEINVVLLSVRELRVEEDRLGIREKSYRKNT
jgi:hypothetical protein